MAEAAVKSDMFVWEGVDRHGKRVKGEMSGKSDALIKATLRRQGVNTLKVKKKPKSFFSAGGKITSKDITVFSRQLATMMSSGVPLGQSFEIVGRGHENPAMQEMILSIKGDIESGTAVNEALAKHPQQFNELYTNLVTAGEQSGILESILHKLATYMEKTEALKSKIKGALFYPIAVVVVAFIITCILMIFVIPQFQEMFSNFGADLPALTTVVINMSKWFQEFWWLMFGVIIGTVVGKIQ